ncbi:MAG: VTT domain-containing protein [Candidatus Binatia bacterium]|nr:VTT domain-containing protein [Candidatus Binatia bacterium]
MKLGLLALLGVAFVFGARLLGLDELLTLDGMRSWVDSWGNLGPVAFIGICTLGIVLYLPESLLLTFGGALFGGWPAFVYGWIATVIGTTATFLIARYLARDYVQRTFVEKSDWFGRLDARFSQNGFIWVFLLRTVLGLAPPLNWAVGATSVPFGSYAAGTALGVIPNVAVFVYFGGSVAVAIENGDWLTPQVLIPAGLVAGFLVVGVLVGRRLLSEDEAS